MHTFQIGFYFVKHFLNQTYILAVFNHKMSKVILFWKLNRFLHSTTLGLIYRDLIKRLSLFPLVKGSVFENNRFGRHFNFYLGVLVGILDFKTATKLFLYPFWNFIKRLENVKKSFWNIWKRLDFENEILVKTKIFSFTYWKRLENGKNRFETFEND